jgi:hypothetical protein
MANPPYEDKILMQLVNVVTDAVSKSPDVSFIFGMPKWDKYKDDAFAPIVKMDKLKATKFIIGDFEVPWFNAITKTYHYIPSHLIYLWPVNEKNKRVTKNAIEEWKTVK